MQTYAACIGADLQGRACTSVLPPFKCEENMRSSCKIMQYTAGGDRRKSNGSRQLMQP